MYIIENNNNVGELTQLFIEFNEMQLEGSFQVEEKKNKNPYHLDMDFEFN